MTDILHVPYTGTVTRDCSHVRALRLGLQGRLVIPADLRERLALRPGDVIVASVEDDRLVIRPRRAVEEELWGLFDGLDRGLADELISERREEARRDDAG